MSGRWGLRVWFLVVVVLGCFLVGFDGGGVFGYGFPGCCFGGGVVGWFCWLVLGSWFCGFGVGVVGLVGSPCDGFCMVCVGIVVVGVMFENSTVCL